MATFDRWAAGLSALPVAGARWRPTPCHALRVGRARPGSGRGRGRAPGRACRPSRGCGWRTWATGRRWRRPTRRSPRCNWWADQSRVADRRGASSDRGSCWAPPLTRHTSDRTPGGNARGDRRVLAVGRVLAGVPPAGGEWEPARSCCTGWSGRSWWWPGALACRASGAGWPGAGSGPRCRGWRCARIAALRPTGWSTSGRSTTATWSRWPSGYYINPLIPLALAVVVLRELRRLQLVALGFGAVAVAVLTVMQPPAVSALVLDCSFGGYGFIKKAVPVRASPRWRPRRWCCCPRPSAPW